MANAASPKSAEVSSSQGVQGYWATSRQRADLRPAPVPLQARWPPVRSKRSLALRQGAGSSLAEA